MSTADKLRAEGRAIGKAQGKAESILQLLTARFGAVTAKITKRVRSAPIAHLDRWTLRVLDTRTITDIFAD